MMRTELSDLDGLMEKVRDPGSRDLVAEAVVAYRAGALRSSIILCWSAVFGDLIAKIRELAQGGNKAAIDYVTRFDQNIGNPQKMLAYEREILGNAGEAFLMLTIEIKESWNGYARIEMPAPIQPLPVSMGLSRQRRSW